MRELTVFPLPGGTYRKSSGYGVRTNPVTGKAGTFHRGCDYAAPHGTPLYAPFDGAVTTGNEPGGAGLWIWVQNGPDLFKSFHHSGYEVRSGTVKAGDTIAYIGTTGSSTGAHAHLELWENGRNIDPTPYLDRAPIKGSAPAPAPIPTPEEDDEVKTAIMWDNQGAAWQCWGIYRRHIATPQEVAELKYLGVQDWGVQQALMAHLTIVPRLKLAGEG